MVWDAGAAKEEWADGLTDSCGLWDEAFDVQLVGGQTLRVGFAIAGSREVTEGPVRNSGPYMRGVAR